MPLIQDYNKLYEENSNIKKIYVNGNVVWPIKFINYSEPFYVENITSNTEILTIGNNNANSPAISIESSIDKINWSALCTTSTTDFTLNLTPGTKLYLRANTNSWTIKSGSSYYYSYIYGISKIGGNIMSLLYGNNFTGNERSFPSSGTIFYLTFRGNSGNNNNLIDAGDLILSATTLTSHCYRLMFQGCKSLIKSPELPATTLASYCYYNMFNGCSSLTTAPVLPATTLVSYCYYGMFSYCTSLINAPALLATTLASYCYYTMFWGCSSLTTAPALPATTLASYCYYRMFYGCSSLTTAPTLPATTLVNRCYNEMFSYCTSLNNVTCLATTGINTDYSTNDWLTNVSSTGIFTKTAGVTWPTGTSGIPSGWTVVEV